MVDLIWNLLRSFKPWELKQTHRQRWKVWRNVKMISLLNIADEAINHVSKTDRPPLLELITLEEEAVLFLVRWQDWRDFVILDFQTDIYKHVVVRWLNNKSGLEDNSSTGGEGEGSSKDKIWTGQQATRKWPKTSIFDFYWAEVRSLSTLVTNSLTH